jgi:hypothetical protein
MYLPVLAGHARSTWQMCSNITSVSVYLCEPYLLSFQTAIKSGECRSAYSCCFKNLNPSNALPTAPYRFGYNQILQGAGVAIT